MARTGKNVHFCPRNKRYQARMTVDGKRRHLGYFINEKLALDKVDREKRKQEEVK